jgi:hypothetical protein
MIYRFITFLAFAASIGWFIAQPGFEPAIACIVAVAAAFRDQIHGVIGWKLLSLTPKSAPIRSLAHTRYSFSRDEFVNPLIIADLYGWISDLGDQIVAIDVAGGNDSNRYSADEISNDRTSPHPKVSARDGESTFTYQYLGCSFSGVHVLQTWDSGGGTGVFCAIMLVTLSAESALDINVDGVERTDRFIVRKVAMIPLGDRYSGKVTYRLGLLTIRECTGRRSLRLKRQRILVI